MFLSTLIKPLSFYCMNIENKITNGYGELIVYSSNKEIPPFS